MSGPPAVIEVDLATFEVAYDRGAVVVDVRRPDEYESGHIPGAVHVPLEDLASRLEDVPAGDPVYVVCAVGGRSLMAAGALAGAGYNAVSVAGGTIGWVERGGQVVAGPSPR